MPQRYLLLVVVLFFAPFITLAQVKTGDKAPEIHITNWIKNAPQSKDLSGKFIVIDFWATWCAPCLESVPHMNNLANKNKARTNLVFLSITDEKEGIVKALLNRVDFSSTVVSDETRQTFDDFNIKDIPFCVVIDDKNIIRWAGNPGDLTNEIISDILDGRVTSPVVTTIIPSAPTKAEKMYEALTNRYATYYKDQDLPEYFNMTLSLFQVSRTFINQHSDSYYNELLISDGLAYRLSTFLDIAENQVILPDRIAKSYISYCYKSQRKIEAKQVLKAILNHLNVEYTVSDSLMDAIQLEVVDKKILKKFVTDLPHISRNSFSASYAAIDNQRFHLLARAIQAQFQKVVVTKKDNILDDKMSLTIKVDNIQNMIDSFNAYGIKATLVKQKVPVYRFTEKR